MHRRTNAVATFTTGCYAPHASAPPSTSTGTKWSPIPTASRWSSLRGAEENERGLQRVPHRVRAVCAGRPSEPKHASQTAPLALASKIAHGPATSVDLDAATAREGSNRSSRCSRSRPTELDGLSPRARSMIGPSVFTSRPGWTATSYRARPIGRSDHPGGVSCQLENECMLRRHRQISRTDRCG
jgi:hypothetical protein